MPTRNRETATNFLFLSRTASEDVSRSHSGGDAPTHEVIADEKRDIKSSGRDSHAPVYDAAILNTDYEGKPTDEELKTLRRVPGKVPMIAYLLCCVEFCERASYYGKLIEPGNSQEKKNVS